MMKTSKAKKCCKLLNMTFLFVVLEKWTSCIFEPFLPLDCVPLTKAGGWAIGKDDLEKCMKEIAPRPEIFERFETCPNVDDLILRI